MIFRADLAVFALPMVLVTLIAQRKDALHLVITGVISSLSSLGNIMIDLLTHLTLIAVTMLVDSILWKRWLWPEGQVLFYNTVLNKSHEWGTQPFLWYFTNAVVRMFTGTIPLVLVGVLLDRYVLLYAMEM